MPRLLQFSPYVGGNQPQNASAVFQSPTEEATTPPQLSSPQILAPPRIGVTRDSNCCSTRLVTLSPDGRSIHSLVGSRTIETRRLPLSGHQVGAEGATPLENVDVADSDGHPLLISTVLPDSVQNSLEIDPPIELICVEGESLSRSSSNTSKQQNKEPTRRLLPRLCLYTRKSAFLFEICFENTDVNNTDGNFSPTLGKVVSVKEPFERYLEISMQTSILRIRPAPQSSAGYATLSPPTSMAALTEDTETNKYTLLVHHSDGTVTAPLVFGIEDLVDDEQHGERFADFCFAQSRGELSLLASTSILLLKRSGDVLCASPVVFDGTVVTKSLVVQAMTYFEGQTRIDDEEGDYDALVRVDRNTAKWRQCKAAAQYFMDVFPATSTDRRSLFCTARVLKYQQEQSAAQWPIKLQGPVLFHSDLEPGPPAVTLDNFGCTDVLVGVAIGKENCKIDFAALSPTCLLPRFAFEKATDGYDLDDALFHLASFVERVDLSEENNNSSFPSNASISVIPDPIVDTLLHYVTPTSVFTVSTNSMRATSLTVKGARDSEPVRTVAWVCLSSNSADPVRGVVVPGEANLGHELIALLNSGSMIPVNVTESKYRHEFESMFQSSSERTEQLLLENSSTGPNKPVPLYLEIEPLVKKIHAGLASMSRIVGSETSYKDITPEALAIAIRIKARSDNEVVLPILELKKTVDKHRASLQSILDSQRTQLDTAVESIKDLKARLSLIGQRVEKTEENASMLLQRSSALLQASQDLLPTVTQAEYDYFQNMKRLKLKCVQMEKDIRQTSDAINLRCESINEDAVRRAMEKFGPNQAKQANALLKAQENDLNKLSARFEEAEKQMGALASCKP